MFVYAHVPVIARGWLRVVAFCSCLLCACLCVLLIACMCVCLRVLAGVVLCLFV